MGAHLSPGGAAPAGGVLPPAELTLDDDEGRGVDAVDAVGRKARVLPAVLLHDILDVQAAGGRDAHARVHRHGRPVPFRPGDLGRGVARGAALQRDALPDQHLRVLGLDHKSGPGCPREAQVLSYFPPREQGSVCVSFPCATLSADL